MRWSSLAWTLVPALALFEVVIRSSMAGHEPRQESIEEAVRLVKSDYRAGDIVVVAPHWFASARSALGSRVLPLADQARPDTAVYERLWEVSIRNHRSSEAEGLEPDLERRFGRVTLRRYSLAPSARVLLDFVSELDTASVSAAAGRVQRPCTRRRGRWRCGGRGRDEWVGTETISDLDHRPRRCIWAHPLPDRRPLLIEFPTTSTSTTSVDAGTAWIEGHTATDYVVGRHCREAPVKLSVRINGERRLTVEHHDCDGWRPFRVDVPEDLETIAVAFEITAPNPEGRHFCLQAQLRRAR